MAENFIEMIKKHCVSKKEVELGVSLDGDVAWVKNGERLSQFV